MDKFRSFLGMFSGLLPAKITTQMNRNLHQPKFSSKQIILGFIGSFVGIAVLAYLSEIGGYPLIAAPLGATSVLVYGLPDSPLAQPRNVVIGNMLGAFISVLFVTAMGVSPWVMGLAVATTIALTQLTRTVHPPAGAVALIGVMSHASWGFLFTPVFVGSIFLVLRTAGMGIIAPERSYPKYWF